MNIALIGLGMVAQTHVRAIRDLGGDARLVGVLSRDRTRAARFIEDCGDELAPGLAIYSSVSEIAADENVVAVSICTPPNARVELVDELAVAGKHILMEKPVERTFTAAQQIVETCAAHRVKLGIFLQHRMRAPVQELRRLLDGGTLGEIALIEIAVPWWREQAYYDEPGRGTMERDGGGVLISQAIHTLDLALSLFGPVSKVQAMARTTALHDMEAEDFVSAGLDFQSGAVGSLVASTASYPGEAESIVAHGAGGSARLASGKLIVTFRDGRKETFGEDAGTGGGADPMAFTHGWHQAIYQDFVDAVREDRDPVVSGRDALQVQGLIDTLMRSSKEGRALSVANPEAL